LWSVPLPLTTEPPGGQGKKKKGKGKAPSLRPDQSFPVVPPCICGAQRKFEFEVLPSILHVLRVEKFAKAKSENAGNLIKEFEQSGMDFGAIGIFSCSESCSKSTTEYVVVQQSVDGKPTKRIFQDPSLKEKDDEI